MRARADTSPTLVLFSLVCPRDLAVRASWAWQGRGHHLLLNGLAPCERSGSRVTGHVGGTGRIGTRVLAFAQPPRTIVLWSSSEGTGTPGVARFPAHLPPRQEERRVQHGSAYGSPQERVVPLGYTEVAAACQQGQR